jgi:hypothetical protein
LYIGSNVYRLAKLFNFDPTVREKIWISMKYALSVDFELLKDNYLDTIIVYIVNQIINASSVNLLMNDESNNKSNSKSKFEFLVKK